MPLLLAVLAHVLPRAALVAWYVSGDALSRAFHTEVFPLLGLGVAPCSTLAYALGPGRGQGDRGGFAVLFLLAIAADVATWIGSEVLRHRPRPPHSPGHGDPTDAA